MMEWAPIQTRIGVTADGIAGPRTYAALFNLVAGRDLGDRGRDLGIGAAPYFTRYGIYEPLRVAHFLGQTCIESGHFQYMRELWGPTPAQLGYEGRGDLGNNQPGDGATFRGRGLIQITGRANYAQVGKRIGMDLVANPTLAERPDIAVLTACDWWNAHGCSAIADADNAVGLSRLINRGSAVATRPANGEADRIAATAKAKSILGITS